jgi:hypothetical protein
MLMSILHRRCFETGVLGLTALALVGHGGSERLCTLQDAERVNYSVIGSCGPAGEVTVSTEEASCGLAIAGDDVGVPTQGEAGGVRSGGWTVTGPTLSGKELRCTAYADSDDRSHLEMTCFDGQHEACRSYFIDSAQACNVHACTVTACDPGFRLELAPQACCPTCVGCPSCIDAGPPPPPVCDPTACPQTLCDQGYELMDAGACCPRCDPVVDLAACQAGRTEYHALLVAQQPQFLKCQRDEECMWVTLPTRCDPPCPVPASGPNLGPPFELLRFAGNELCLHCPAPEAGCTGFRPQPLACVNGACQPAGTGDAGSPEAGSPDGETSGAVSPEPGSPDAG